jgi:hypothetical protein
MENQKSIDKLAVICKVFMDARVLALRKENELLRLQLFWRDHKIQKLVVAMNKANFGREDSIKCSCWKCASAGRIKEGVKVDLHQTCRFIPWFEAKLTECGLTYENLPHTHSHTFHVSNSMAPVCDVDSHFVETAMMGGFIHKFTYGSKLWKAQSVESPEIKKLEKLFELITHESLSG